MELKKFEVDRLRRMACRAGLRLVKSRVRLQHSNNRGGLMLVDWQNTVYAGDSFDLDTKQAEYWIDRYVAEGRGWKRSA